MQNPSRRWCFTWNNPPPDAYARFTAARAATRPQWHITAIAIGREGLGDIERTPHLQGWMAISTPQRLSALTRAFPGVHFEIMRGTESQAIEYTHKEHDENRLDWDDRQQGARSDLSAMAALVQSNPYRAAAVCAAEMPTLYLKYHGGVNALARALVPRRAPLQPRYVHWFYGPAGTGKTHTAVTEALALVNGVREAMFVWTLHSLKWAGSYTGQSVVVIDELRDNWSDFSYARLLTLLSHVDAEVEVKGGQVPWNADHIFITTPAHPNDFVTPAELFHNPQAQDQLTRRICDTRLFDVRHANAQATLPGVAVTSVVVAPIPSPPSPTTTEPLAPVAWPPAMRDSPLDDPDYPQRSPPLVLRSDPRSTVFVRSVPAPLESDDDELTFLGEWCADSAPTTPRPSSR